MKLSKIFRKVYDATSDSRSKFGKIGKYAFPLNAPYHVRDAWRKYGKRFLSAKANSASVISSGAVYGPSGSIVGRY